MSLRERSAAARGQRMSLIYGVMAVVLFLLVVQTLLLSASLEAYFAGQASVCVPAAGASGLCFAAAWWLMGRLLDEGDSHDAR